mgnify:CR=1 FL=1
MNSAAREKYSHAVSSSPGSKRLGFGAEDLLAARPDLIVCSITGYGAEGPRAAQKAYDLLLSPPPTCCCRRSSPSYSPSAPLP